ncbi:MAG: SIS domain-containing protein [Planctomycetaceae bacterium]|nr:SIS domain-containing protein [Planctomycetaceae bacterium]
MPSPSEDYLAGCRHVLDRVAAQSAHVQQAAEWFAESIHSGRLVHLFGAGHSRIMVEEMWPRYGSFPGFHPIVELSLTFHNQVAGANGQRQAMFLETQTGLAERILRNFHLSSQDTALVVSSSGCNTVPIEMAQLFQAQQIKVVAMVSLAHCRGSQSKHPHGKKLIDCADLILDTGAPLGDALVRVPGLETPVAPASTIGGCLLINALKAEVAARLVERGEVPNVLTAAALVGTGRATQLFEAAYDEHGRRVSQLYQRPEIGRGDAIPGS